MEQDNELQRLERFVEKLLTRFSELRAEKTQCMEQIRERDEIIAGLRENISSKDMERDEIGSRVNKIVAQIEEWESNLEETVPEEVPEVPEVPEAPEVHEDQEDAVDESVEEQVDEVSAETADDGAAVNERTGVEEEKRVQHNLFSMGTSSYDRSSE